VKAQIAKRGKHRNSYPLTTHASEVAERGRKKANKMTREEADYHFRRAMARIYGAPSSQTSVAGHERPV